MNEEVKDYQGVKATKLIVAVIIVVGLIMVYQNRKVLFA